MEVNLCPWCPNKLGCLSHFNYPYAACKSSQVNAITRKLHIQALVNRLFHTAVKKNKRCALAVSTGHAGCDGRPVYSHPLVKRFLRGARRVRPVSRMLTTHWDLPTVLRGLSRDPFKPVSQAPLDALSILIRHSYWLWFLPSGAVS